MCGQQLILGEGGIACSCTDEACLAHCVVPHHHALYGLDIWALIVHVRIRQLGPDSTARGRHEISPLEAVVALSEAITTCCCLASAVAVRACGADTHTEMDLLALCEAAFYPNGSFSCNFSSILKIDRF
ncbi:hypothetical protein JZ751_012109 [Albula glossodonta]|uniref:Uncharacterized protein n=1 Tax=Albula glossodonta TaxID=121402 RepID=A0A8T2PRK7_9TELE|nr:hypothetical protein JZ751_012109 [Albula glossodonta]